MKNLLRDHRSSMLPRHAGWASLFALAVIVIGIVLGFGAVELYETANGWVLQA